MLRHTFYIRKITTFSKFMIKFYHCWFCQVDDKADAIISKEIYHHEEILTYVLYFVHYGI